MGEEKLSQNQYVIAVVLFVFSYFLLYLIGVAKNVITNIPVIELVLTLPDLFQSPMFYLAMPVFGFWAVFFLVDWINDQFETNLGLSPALPIVFFFLALFAYYVALYWYTANFASLSGVELTLDQVDFKGKLQSSAYLFFLWAGVFGWISRYAVAKIKL